MDKIGYYENYYELRVWYKGKRVYYYAPGGKGENEYSHTVKKAAEDIKSNIFELF